MNAIPETNRILVVDDERVVADCLAAVLRTQGYKALAAYSAASAISIAEEVALDTLISDVMMPGLNGIELAAYFAEYHPACSVMLMSGDSTTAALLDKARHQAYGHPVQTKVIAPAHILEMLAAVTASA